MDGQIFRRLRHRIKTGNDQLIYLEDIAQITGDEFAVQTALPELMRPDHGIVTVQKYSKCV